MNGSVEPLEVESLNPKSKTTVSAAAPPPTASFLERGWTLLKLYMEYYPKITAVVVFLLIGVVMSITIPNLRKPVTRNRLEHDYSHIARHYDFKAAQIDHWCLWVSAIFRLCGNTVAYDST